MGKGNLAGHRYRRTANIVRPLATALAVSTVLAGPALADSFGRKSIVVNAKGSVHLTSTPEKPIVVTGEVRGSVSRSYDPLGSIFSSSPIDILVQGKSDAEIKHDIIEGLFGHRRHIPRLAGLSLASPEFGVKPAVDLASSATLTSTGVHDSFGTGRARPAVKIISQAPNGANGSHGSFFRSGHPGHPGGNGADLVFTNSGDISVSGPGDGRAAILVESLAGNGGHGGKAGGGAAGGHGGAGGRGGDGGKVAVNNVSAGTITTDAKGSDGIRVRSAGGEGGSAGGAIFASSGNDGGVGGNGGEVWANNDGTIVTKGEISDGIEAESVGGGGGSGSGGGWFGGSGHGGSGNNGHKVSVANTGSISTSGGSSVGMLGSSVGANGGDGGSGNAAFVAVGASGGKGGKGGEVKLANTGSVTTTGGNATGVYGHSVGGGGGRGGRVHSGGVIVSVSVGGSGGAGGKGGAISYDAKGGSVTTSGDGADGVLLHSVGGGGGKGGHAVAVAAGPAGIGVAVGGKGGSGGDGGALDATLDSASSIRTGSMTTDASGAVTYAGDNSAGLVAQSVGGGGGRGGLAVAVGVGINPVEGPGVGISVAVGGSGGSGGHGGGVQLDNSASIETFGRNAPGLLLQSTGGGGGHGGNAISVAAGAGEQGAAAAIGVGGSGGDGGKGDDVIAWSGGAITTHSALSTGIVAQSTGGGGGHGGNVVTVAAAFGQQGGSASVGVGGTGGKGGGAGKVNVENTGSVTTFGDHADGVLVQSTAGGGGFGGDVHSYSLTATAGGGGGGKSMAFNVAVGGKGGTGDSGNDAVFTNNGSIATGGNNSSGVIVQSQGGGGGVGGSAVALTGAVSAGANAFKQRDIAFSVSVGGQGGTGAKGGAASFVAGAGSTVSTTGDESDGVIVQSIGGGGGRGGHALAGSLATPIPSGGEPVKPDDVTKGLAGAVSVGGHGGKGGAGGTVSVELARSSQITTKGTGSVGVYAQSVGGGGGRGGASTSEIINGFKAYGLAISVGGSGGSGNHGGSVNVNETGGETRAGGIRTLGDHAHGLLAQSIGGGGGGGGAAKAGSKSIPFVSGTSVQVAIGGNAGSSGDGGAVTVARDATISTAGQGAYGLFAHSVGGGGGEGHDGGNAAGNGLIGFSLGGKGASAGKGSSVSVTGSAPISTTGALGHGVVAQSVGGGGGAGGSSSGGFHGLPLGISFHFGGEGGGGGDGGAVSVNKSGRVATTGNHAFGVIAQSVGGGGGIGGAGKVISVVAPISTHAAGGGNGNGGAVTVSDKDLSGTLDISTSGTGAVGIFAQSVGGGGGLVVNDNDIDPTVLFDEDASSKTKGGGGNVTVFSRGSITTTGAHSDGIVAQSTNGSTLIVFTNKGMQTGTAGLTSTESGAVTVTANGMIDVSGDDANGISAFANRWNGLAIQVDVNGTVTSHGKDSAAIQTLNGDSAGFAGDKPAATVLTRINVNKGALVQGLGGTVNSYGISVTEAHGQAEINIDGTVTGVANGAAIGVAGAGTLTIGADGVVNGDVENFSERLGIQINGAMNGSLFIGDYALNEGGIHRPMIDLKTGFSNSSIVSSVSALDGAIIPAITSFGANRFGKMDLITSDTNVQWQAPDEAFVAVVGRAAAAGFDVVTDDKTLSIQNYRVDFNNALWETQDEETLADHANQLIAPWMAGGDPSDSEKALYSVLLDAANIVDSAELGKALAKIDASRQFSTALSQTNAGTAHLDAMMSCGVATGTHAAIAEGACVWAKATGGQYSHSGNGFNERYAGLAVGQQFALDANWRVGVSAGFEGSWFRGEGTASDGYRVHGGLAVKYVDGPWLGSASVSVSHGWADAVREIAHTGGVETATSRHESTAVSARLRAARLFEIGGLDLTPRVDFDMTWVHDGGYRETGAGALNMTVHGQNQFLFDIHPAVRLGTEHVAKNGVVFRPWVEAGARFALNDATVTASMDDSALAGERITQGFDRDRVAATIGAGVDVLKEGGVEAKLSWESVFGRYTSRHQASVKLGISF